jgi:hypothetical protein
MTTTLTWQSYALPSDQFPEQYDSLCLLFDILSFEATISGTFKSMLALHASIYPTCDIDKGLRRACLDRKCNLIFSVQNLFQSEIECQPKH